MTPPSGYAVGTALAGLGYCLAGLSTGFAMLVGALLLSGKGARHQRRGDRMLRAGADAGEQERTDQHRKTRAHAGEAIADTGERGAEREHDRGAKSLGEVAGRNLQRRHGAGEHAAQHAERGIGQGEFGLPQRQHDVDEIGIAVVQRVRDTGNTGGAPLLARHSRL